MDANTKKVVDALKRFPTQKLGFVALYFSESGIQMVPDLIPDSEAMQVVRHLHEKAHPQS